MPSGARPVYILIEAGVAERSWPIFGTTDGGQATIIFSCATLAQRFIDGMNLSGKWEAAELPSSEFHNWIEECGRRGAANAVIDPDPAADDHRSLPLVAVLIQAELDSKHG